MKRMMFVALVLLLAAFPLAAQSSSNPQGAGQGTPQATQTEPPASDTPSSIGGEKVEGPAAAPATVTPLFTNFIGAGLQGRNVDTNSSKWEEYRDIPEGLVGPELRLFGSTANNTWLVTAEKIQEEDRRFDVRFDSDVIGIDFFYDQIPHRLGNEAKSVLNRVSEDQWGLADNAQRQIQSALEAQFAANPSGINFNFLNNLVGPLINTPYVFDLGFDRLRGGLALQLFPEGPVDTRVSFFQENREGTRAAGTAFGFGNVVETGEPIDYVTREAGVRLEAPFKNGLVRGAVVLNEFQNRISSYTFDNPFRVTDSTDASAYQAPGRASINGASFGRIALAPDSTQFTASIGGLYRLPMNTRVTADVSFGTLRSDDELIPFTTNTSIRTPSGHLATDPSALPVSEFEGEINTVTGIFAITSRPVAGLNLTARYRLYDLDNDSPRIRFEEGYVRFDGVWEDIPRITVPYGWTNNRLDLIASYDLFGGIASIEGGFRRDIMERTFRETEETTEDTFRIAGDVRPFSWLVARASYEFGNRDFDHYDPEHSEHASYLDAGDPVNLTLLRRYDQAARDTQRLVTMVRLQPLDSLGIGVNYVRYFDDYDDESDFGLLQWRNASYTVDADYTPSDRWSVFAFYTHDDLRGFQRGRQSGGTLSTNPADDWTADNTDKANSWGAGANFNIIPDKISLNLTTRFQQVTGWANLESPPGGTPDLAFDIPALDDTTLLTATAELSYIVSNAWNLAVGTWFEDYEIRDALQTGVRPYMPGGFFLVPEDGDYNGVVAYVRSTYRW